MCCALELVSKQNFGKFDSPRFGMEAPDSVVVGAGGVNIRVVPVDVGFDEYFCLHPPSVVGCGFQSLFHSKMELVIEQNLTHVALVIEWTLTHV